MKKCSKCGLIFTNSTGICPNCNVEGKNYEKPKIMPFKERLKSSCCSKKQK